MTRFERHVTVIVCYADDPGSDWVDVRVNTDIGALTNEDLRAISDAVAQIIGKRTGIPLQGASPRVGYG